MLIAPLIAMALVGSAEPTIPQVGILPSPLVRSAAAFSDRADVNLAVSRLESIDSAWFALDGLETVVLAGVPLAPGIEVDAALRRLQPLAEDGVVVAAISDGRGGTLMQTIPAPALECWAGPILGHDGGRLFLARSDSFTHGYAFVDDRTFIITSGPPGGVRPLIAYELGLLPADAIVWSPFECTTAIEGHFPRAEANEGGVASGPLPCRHVKIAIDSDNELAEVFGNNVTATASYILLQAAAMSEIYTSQMNLRIQASFVRVWTTPDPWTQGSAGAQLGQFRDFWEANMGSVTRDAAMLLSARSLGGGVAWLSAMCGPWAYSVSGNLSGFFPYPLLDNAGQNWDIMVTSHELGHNLGTPHTHNYCPPVDECAPAGWYGQCQSQQVCTNQGTIMSYCHLCSGGLSNVKLTFADASIQSMDAHLNSLPCNYSGATLAPWAVPDFVAGFQSTFVIDVLANDLPVNCQDVVIHSFTQPTSGPGVVTLLSGAGPNGRDVLQFSAPTWFNGVSTFSYTIRNTSNLVSAASPVTVTIPTLTLGKSVVNALPNLSVLYFDLVNPTQLPIFDLLNPYLQTTTPHINYPSTNGNFANSNRADNVGALWTGWIQIPEPGLWTFFLESDDGSRLLLNDQLVINNDGLHGMLEKSATVALGKGHHKLRVEFFEAGGGAGCILSMSGPGVPKAPVPPARFSRGGSILAADLNYDGVVNGADLAVMLGLWNTPSPLADLNGDGNVDGADLAILLGSWSN